MKSWPELTDNPEAYDEPRVYALTPAPRKWNIKNNFIVWIVFFAIVTLVGWWV